MPYIAGVSERDIDLLLLEEFMSSIEFQNLFLKLTNFKNQNLNFIEAQRAVTDTTGESDLEITFQSKENKKYKLLIENKINASFQKDQRDRYILRGNNYIKLNKIVAFTTILIAPQKYTNNNLAGFDYRINYETLIHYFQNNKKIGKRKNYKILLLQSAIEKATKGYQVKADESVTKFWNDYWYLSLQIVPEFNMKKPSSKPASSSFVYFRVNHILPKNIDLVHKLTHGYFDLQFKGMGNKLNEMRIKYSHLLTKDMQIVQANKSASIRVEVPKLSLANSLESQKEKVIEAMNKGKKLLKWFEKTGEQSLKVTK